MFDEKSYSLKMDKAIDVFSKEMSSLRTGRANTNMLDTIKVDVYGQQMPINQLASITTPEPRCINIQVWDLNNVSFSYDKNKNVLNNLGENGVLINVARGSVIDQDELIHCLENNLILAAGLDVYTNEPNIPEKLMKLQNSVLLPHIASGTVETRNAMGQLVFDNIINYFEGKSFASPANIITISG